MGVASALFFSTDAEKVTLHRRITPSDDQFKFQQLKWNALAEHLWADLKEQSGCAITTWLQGSYKFATQIRPTRRSDEFDIDLGIYFEWSGKPEDGAHDPEDLRFMVQDSLNAYEDEDVLSVVRPPKERCCRIRYRSDFHIDIPAYHIDSDRDARTLAAGNEWEESDPKALYLWFKDRFDDATRFKARRQIRYMKCWSCLKRSPADGRPSSTLLTVLVAEAMDSLGENELASDDETLGAVLRAITRRLKVDTRVVNPVNDDEVLSNRLSVDEMDQFINDLEDFLEIAESALDKADIVSAGEKWSDAFHHFLPLPDIDDLRKSAEGGRNLPVPMLVPEVHVRATPKGRPDRQYQGRNSIGPIPKNCDIYFTLVNFDGIPNDAKVEWMVRNEGDEAENTNDLGHRAGVGKRATERSAYNGMHYMDCVIKRHGVILGLRRIPVTISDRVIPPRNPHRRPAYTRIRGRR